VAPHELTRADVSDADFTDAAELAATGLADFRSGVAVASTVSATKTVNLVAGAALVHGDDPVEPEDKISLTGCAAAGTYTVATVVDDVTLTVAEAISDSTGGAAAFRYVPGAQRVGFNPTGLVNISAQTVQAALVQVDGAISAGGITEAVHEALDTIVHEIDETSYDEVTYTGSNPTNVTTWATVAKLKKIREEQYTYASGKVTQCVTIQYDSTGAEKMRTTEVYTYTGSKITSIARTKV